MDSFTTEQEGAFDEAVKGVDAIEHTASPFHFKSDDPNGVWLVCNHDIITCSLMVADSRIDCTCSQRHSGHTPKCSKIRVCNHL